MAINIVLSLAVMRTPTSAICPGCAEVAGAPRSRTRSDVVLDADGRPWHVGCALSALAQLAVDRDE